MPAMPKNPEDTKKKTSADEAEELRNQKDKKRQNPKSQTDKDEKNQSGQQADAKKNVGNQNGNPVNASSVFKDLNVLFELTSNISSKNKKNKVLDFSKQLNEALVNRINTITDDKLGNLKKSMLKSISARESAKQKKEKKEKFKAGVVKGIGEAVESIGESVTRGFNIGRNLL